MLEILVWTKYSRYSLVTFIVIPIFRVPEVKLAVAFV